MYVNAIGDFTYICILTNTSHTEYLSCNSNTCIYKNARLNNIEKCIFRDRQFICKIRGLSKRFDSNSYLKIVNTFYMKFTL